MQRPPAHRKTFPPAPIVSRLRWQLAVRWRRIAPRLMPLTGRLRQRRSLQINACPFKSTVFRAVSANHGALSTFCLPEKRCTHRRIPARAFVKRGCSTMQTRNALSLYWLMHTGVHDSPVRNEADDMMMLITMPALERGLLLTGAWMTALGLRPKSKALRRYCLEASFCAFNFLCSSCSELKSENSLTGTCSRRH